MESKVCNACNIEKPVSKFTFRKDSNNYRSDCKDCVTERVKQYTEKNKEKIDAYKKGYRQKKKQFISDKNKLYRSKPEVKAKRKIYDRMYRLNNPNIMQKSRTNHRFKKNERQKKNQIILRKTDLSFLITSRLRSRIGIVLRGKCKSDKTYNLLGCNAEEFKKYFESLFTGSMSWGAFMSGEIHIDHKIPCASFDLTNEEEQRKCFHYTNLQPLWKIDNLKKGAKYHKTKAA